MELTEIPARTGQDGPGRARPGPAGAGPGWLEAARTIRMPKIWIWAVEMGPLGKKFQNHPKFPPRDQWGD